MYTNGSIYSPIQRNKISILSGYQPMYGQPAGTCELDVHICR